MFSDSRGAADAKEGTASASRALSWRTAFSVAAAALVVLGALYVLFFSDANAIAYERAEHAPPPPAWPLPLDKAAYDAKMLFLAHYVRPVVSSTTATSTLAFPMYTASSSVSVPGKLWPKSAAYPEGGALLPFNRIVAFYGNFYSKQMGVLGEYPPETVLAKLASTTDEWRAADPSTPVIPAIQYIATVAQGAPGKSGLWRAQMPDEEIDKALGMANQVHGLLILDVQVGKSTLEAELPVLEKYLAMRNVELGIDPEFSMKGSAPPGTVIGTFTAADVNYAAHYLAQIVRENKLPPKILVVHRFTYDMVQDPELIKPLPEVEVVMDMDGWGEPARKFNTYKRVIAPYPVEFTGMKLFFHADLKPPSTRLLTPSEVLGLTPSPIYIQYQ